MNPVIAIDGTAASGKSTVSKIVSSRLGWTYVDTGAMYRAFAWLAAKNSVDVAKREQVAALIPSSRFFLTIEEGATRIHLGGKIEDSILRTEEVNVRVSGVASIPEIREHLVNRQRELRLEGPLVVEGRDIGTVVFPDTPAKFFLDACAEIRAQRREAEGISDRTSERDRMDSTRKVGPLLQAADAIFVDSSGMSAGEVASFIIRKSSELGVCPKH